MVSKHRGKSRGFLGVCTHTHDEVRNERIAAQAMGGCHSGNKNGGLKVHNKSIASRAMGDAAWATKKGGLKVCKKNC